MQTLNIRCSWNDLQERRLCASLQKCANRLHWKTISFVITHYNDSLHFSVQVTVHSVVKSEKKQKPEATSSPVSEQQQEKVRKLSTKTENKLSEDTGPKKELIKEESSIEAKKKVPDFVSPILKPGKQSPVESEKKPSEEIKEQNATSSVPKEKQKIIRHDAATQTNLDAGKELHELSDFTTVLFGPCPLISNWTRSIKCVQVGDGNIKQLKQS